MNDEETWDQEYAEYEAIPSSDRKAVSYPLEVMAEYITFDEVDTVAEVGCGNGRNTAYLAKQDTEITAIDFSAEALGRARDRTQQEGITDAVTFFKADVSEHLPLPDDSIDLVVDSYTTCHFLDEEELEQYLEEVERVLSSDGQLYWSGMSADDGYYGKLGSTHPADGIIVDPLNNVAKRLYTQEEIENGLPGGPSAEYAEEVVFTDFVRDELFERHVLAALYRF